MKTILYVSMILSAMPLPAQESVERLDAKLDTIISGIKFAQANPAEGNPASVQPAASTSCRAC